MKTMRRLNGRGDDAAPELFLYLGVWLFLYYAPDAVLGAGFADRTHVLFEGLAALFLLIPFLRDGPPPRGPGRPRYWIIPLVLVPMAILRRYAAGIFCHAGETFYSGSMDAMLGPGMYKWRVLRTCATAPLMEELGCRWIAFGKARRAAGFWPSALLSALVYAAIHAGVDHRLAISVIPSALLLCLAYELTGKLYWCVAGHAAFNVLCLPEAPWVTPEWAARYAGVPKWAGPPALIAATAAIALLCAFRKKIFLRKEAERCGNKDDTSTR